MAFRAGGRLSRDQFYGQLALERLGRPVAAAARSRRPTDRGRAHRLQAAPIWSAAVRYLGAAPAGTATRRLSSARSRPRSTTIADRALAGEFGRQIGRLDLGVWAAREARCRRRQLLRATPASRLSLPAGFSSNWALAPRHQPPGKLVRSRRGQPCRRARHDAADARHGARARPADRACPTIRGG